MNKFTKELDEAIDLLITYGGLAQKKPHDYGCGIMLYMGDIHMIEAIGNHPNYNLTQLAEFCGLTKGTVSKRLSKIEKAGFISRFQDKNNSKEYYFYLTDLGKQAYQGHYKFHEERSVKTHDKYQQYNVEEKKLLLDFVKLYSDYLKDYI